MARRYSELPNDRHHAELAADVNAFLAGAG